MPLNTLVVDDEPLAREGLRMLLSSDPDVALIHEAKDGREALGAIRDLQPDLVFLDVQMPEMDGMAVLAALDAAQLPAIIFVTAYDRYAIQAFEINAIDYLLKPVTEERFRKALARAKLRLQNREQDNANRQILSLLETIASRPRHLKRLAVRGAGKTIFVDVQDVDWVEAAENYVQLHVGKSGHLLHVAMNTFEKSLDPEVFLRIHRSIIVNVGRIKQLQPAAHGEYVVTLEDGVRLQSGRAYSEKLRLLAANPF